MKKTVVWGAGREGRGFIGELFETHGELVFVDSNEALIERLRREKKYTLYQYPAAGEPYEKEVSGFEALLVSDEAVREKISEADVIALCVYLKDMEEAVRQIIPGLELRKKKNPFAPLDIIIGANAIRFAPKLQKVFEKYLDGDMREWFLEKVGVVEALLRRTCVDPEEERSKEKPLSVCTNDFPELLLDAALTKVDYTEIPGIRLTNEMLMEEKRKIYTYNLIHAVYAYLGAQKGYTYLYECREDEEIRRVAEDALSQSSAALQKEYGIAPEEMREYERRMRMYVITPAMKDRVRRTGCDPIRKLSREERILGPALLCRKHGIKPDAILKTAAYALAYLDEEDESSVRLHRMVEKIGPERTLEEFGNTEIDAELRDEICAIYKKDFCVSGL